MNTPAQILRQKVEELDGSRRNDRPGRAAVRLDDLNGLLRLDTKLKSQKVSGSVTVEDFNAMIDDVQEMHRRLLAVVGALRARRGR